LSCVRQRGDGEKRLKIISRQKNNKKQCTEWDRKEEIGMYCTVSGELIIRTRLGLYVRSYYSKKRPTVQYMGSHTGKMRVKQFQKQDTLQEANPPHPSPVTVHMQQACRIELRYASSHTEVVQKKEQKPRRGMSHLDVISPSLSPAAFPRPGLPCAILRCWILHHLFLIFCARMSSRR